jgi:hypothetical protein
MEPIRHQLSAAEHPQLFGFGSVRSCHQSRPLLPGMITVEKVSGCKGGRSKKICFNINNLFRTLAGGGAVAAGS